MRNKLAFLIFFTLLLIGCKPSVPDGVLSPKEMEDVLYDYHLADAMAQDDDADQGYKERMYRAGVLKKHDVTQAVFDSSMVYYLRHTEELQKIYERLSDRLNDEIVALGGSTRSMGDFTMNGDTANIWNGARTMVLDPHEPFNLYNFEIPVDSSFHKGDRLMLNFESEFIYQDGMRDGVAVLAVKFGNDSIATQSIHMSSPINYRLTIADNDHYGIKEIKGFFILNRANDPSGQSLSTLRLMILKNITFVRMREPKLDPEQMKQDSINAARADSMQMKRMAPLSQQQLNVNM